MKPKGPELGNLSSRFFAFVQLKKLDVVRTGELAPILDISASQEHDLLRRLSDSSKPNRRRDRRCISDLHQCKESHAYPCRDCS